MKGKVEAGMEFRYWSEDVNISNCCLRAASSCQAPAGARLPGAGSFTAGLETEAGRNGRSFSRMTPPWPLLLGAPISAHSFPFPLWTKLQAGSSRSHGLNVFTCQAGGRCSKAMEWEYGKDAEKTVTFAHWGFLFAYKEFVLSESGSCYSSFDVLQEVLPKSL